MLDLEVALYVGAVKAKEMFKDFLTDEKGDTNFISVIIVLCIVCGLAAVFRKNIAEIVNGIWTSVFKDAKSATGGSVGSKTTFN